jgi:glycosyltransferase involved in cell wall biosynthesis
MKLSVVTISLDQSKFLQNAIDSVTVGPQHRLQYVIVDPGSTDGSRQIIERNRHQFSRILLDPDNGPAEGLNNGFAVCDGDIFAYLNADDRYPAGALDYVLDYFRSYPEIDVLFGAIAIIDSTGKRSIRKRVPDTLVLAKYAEESCNVYCPSTFIRREAFLKAGGFNPTSRLYWDGELAVDLALSGARFGYSRRVLGEFRIYPQSLTGSGNRGHHAYYERIRQKIYQAGYSRRSPVSAIVARVIYRLNPFRQLKYILAK